MRRNLAVLAALLLVSWPASAQSEQHAPAVTLACRALEIHADPELRVAAIVFHQSDEAQRSELAGLLRNFSGQMVEIQGADGQWHSARMVRLKSCFGRGMLLLPSPAPFAEHSQFLLRVPGGTAPSKAQP